MDERMLERLRAYYQDLSRTDTLAGRCSMSLPPWLSGLRVIDVLCRSGKGAFKLSDAVGDAGFVLGVDPDKSCIERAIAAASGNHRSGHGWSRYLRFEQAFPENLVKAGVSDASYDAVYVNCGLADVFDLPAALAEFHRCLKPGGFLWVAEGVFRSARGYEDEASEEPAPMQPAPHRTLTIDVFAHLCRDAGFGRVEVGDVVPVPTSELALPEGCEFASLVVADIKATA
ncbi:methyltransferase domain-containing protein [uncultured Senegalimassilia sp.]|uniref:class I SAM-dependent methyltransferase n=1 Tax=uncultured Senegalimassilia sp. TaxID=1714350 RepID=UPI0025CD3EC9|nr:methyltransferase domain-containing protein [uncultured Senegalimassilia sp.]